jgi:anti-sigma regulatory factor (Ser/Thr protein kinase)
VEKTLIGFGTQESYRVGDPSDIAVVRRAGVALGKTQSFDEVRLGQLAIVITEAATNIIKHAGDGHILLRALYFESVTGVEIMSVDAGPGIADLELQMRDGNSTAGSYGVGLGAIERLSQEFDIYTNTGQGTVIRTVLWRDGEKRSELPWLAGSVCLPMAGEEVCGDAFTVVANRDICTWILADGLGHGSLAAEASQKAIAVGDAGGEATPEELLQDIHCALRGSRGAAVAVGQINRELRVLRFSGITAAICYPTTVLSAAICANPRSSPNPGQRAIWWLRIRTASTRAGIWNNIPVWPCVTPELLRRFCIAIISAVMTTPRCWYCGSRIIFHDDSHPHLQYSL